MRFQGKRALVTGAASGIGKAVAERLAAEGCERLALVDRASLGAFAQARRFVIDVSDPAAWDGLEAEVRTAWGGIDLCVICAGVSGSAPIAEMSFEEWRRVLSVNLDGAFLSLRAALRLAGEGAAIVALGSAIVEKAAPGTAAYAASKAALAQLATVAALEGASRKVRVNTLMPGGVVTPIWRGMAFFEDLVRETGSEQAAFAALAGAATPLGRYASAEETAAQALFLLSEEAATITGARIVADGGYSLA